VHTQRRFTSTPAPEENPYFHREHSGEERVVSSRLFVGAGMFVIALGLFYLFSYDRSFQLELTVQGINRANPEFIEGTAQDILSSRTWLFLKRDKYLTLNKKYLAEELLARVGETIALEDVQVQKKFPNELIVTIVEREPELLWTTAGTTYLLDAEGVIVQELIFDTANPPAELASKPNIIDLNDFPVEIGQVAIIQETPQTVLTADAKFTELSLSASAYQIPEVSCAILLEEVPEEDAESVTADATVENEEETTDKETNMNTNARVNVNITPPEPECSEEELARNTRTVYAQTESFQIRFSNQNLDQQLAKLERLVHEGFFTGRNLTYVDIRFGERVYYQ
jgi:hypothetical protein